MSVLPGGYDQRKAHPWRWGRVGRKQKRAVLRGVPGSFPTRSKTFPPARPEEEKWGEEMGGRRSPQCLPQLMFPPPTQSLWWNETNLLGCLKLPDNPCLPFRLHHPRLSTVTRKSNLSLSCWSKLTHWAQFFLLGQGILGVWWFWEQAAKTNHT